CEGARDARRRQRRGGGNRYRARDDRRRRIVLGTPAYMSPEQAGGQPVDKRTDVWAFGCVLFEMLTGRRAFVGERSSDVLVDVADREPALDALPAECPPAVRRLLRRCLTQDFRHRL